MKKTLSLLLSCTMLFTLASCGDKEDNTQTAQQQPKVEVAKKAETTTAQPKADSQKEASATDSNGFSPQFHVDGYEDLPMYKVQMKDGELIPPALYVPAHQKFRIYIENIGNKPGEFESHQLRQEKVLYMGSHTTLIVLPLDPGEYDYFDDFTPGPKGKIVAK